jgi:hypothetical protein
MCPIYFFSVSLMYLAHPFNIYIVFSSRVDEPRRVNFSYLLIRACTYITIKPLNKIDREMQMQNYLKVVHYSTNELAYRICVFSFREIENTAHRYFICANFLIRRHKYSLSILTIDLKQSTYFRKRLYIRRHIIMPELSYF